MKYLTCPICGKIHLDGILWNLSLRYAIWRTERDMRLHPERFITIKTKEDLDKFFKELWDDE